jgi:hypothetical protein
MYKLCKNNHHRDTYQIRLGNRYEPSRRRRQNRRELDENKNEYIGNGT